MARKHVLPTLDSTSEDRARIPSTSRADYVRRGASRSMIQTLDEMAENSMRLMEGESIVNLSPGQLEVSPYADRIGESDEEFDALLNAIREAGQLSPILVRPHPKQTNRYIIVYGHRRARAAEQLGIPVRAVIKPLADISHIIAQGQENAARADLTFIEKSVFATKLHASGIAKEHIKQALTIDDALLSRMLSVVETIPAPILETVGAARGIGRDRWEQLKRMLQHPAVTQQALTLVNDGALAEVAFSERFPTLLKLLSSTKRRSHGGTRVREKRWNILHDAVQLEIKDSGRSFTLAVKAQDASDFSVFLADNLERLYQEFHRQSETQDKP